MAKVKDDSNQAPGNDAAKNESPKVTTATTGDERARENGVPSNTVAVPIQVVSRDEIVKDEYTLADGKLEIDRGHPNYIFDNQRNQQAAENTVEIASGIRTAEGKLNQFHPQADDAASVVVDKDSGETAEEKKNRENLKK